MLLQTNGSFLAYPETTFFDQATVPVQFVLEQSGVTEIIFLYDQQGILDLPDLEQQCIIRIEKANPVMTCCISRHADHHISIALVPDYSGGLMPQ